MEHSLVPAPQKILILSLKYLGDLIAATPALRAADESFPDARITLALRAGYEGALEGNPHVDELMPIVMNDMPRRSLPDVIRTAFSIRQQKFDMVIALEAGNTESLWAFFSGAGRRVAPAFQQWERLSNILVPIRENSMNFIEYYCAIVRAAGATVGAFDTEIFISKESAIWARAFLERNFPNRLPLIGVHPGAREKNRRWAAAKFSSLIARLALQGAYNIILMSGRGETQLLGEIRAGLPAGTPLVCADELTIQKTAALMQQCSVCVTNDSAPRHIAAAVGTPTVATIPREKVHAWSLYDPAKHALLVGDDANPDALVDSVSAEEMYAAVTARL